MFNRITLLYSRIYYNFVNTSIKCKKLKIKKIWLNNIKIDFHSHTSYILSIQKPLVMSSCS